MLFSLFLGLLRPILPRQEAVKVFFNFLNIFTIFLEFSITHVGTDRTDNFYFFSFSAFSNLFWLEMKPIMVYFNFFNFIAIFLEFSISRWVGTERNEMIIFIFTFSHLFQTYFGLKRIHNGIFYFFAIFLEFSITRRVGTKRNDNFYFLSFSSFSNLFLLEMRP